MSVDFNIGEVVPGTHYRVVFRIGQGGMGSVYEVEHVELGKRFVLKALLPQFLERKDLVQRLRNEWRSLGKLEHPNIVSVSDAGVAKNGVPFYVMERLQGETLAAALKTRGRLPLLEALRIACEVLEGLSAAHEIGVVHRDVKPPNIFLTQGGVAKVLDFGIAKLTDGASLELTGRGIAIGTPRYMSPEQAAGEPVDGRADLYAVGLLLFEMVAGSGPFDGGDPNEVFLAHLTRQPPRLASLVPTIPAELDGLTAALLAKHPSERPATAGAAARVLRGILRVLPQLRPDTFASPMSGALTPVLPQMSPLHPGAVAPNALAANGLGPNAGHLSPGQPMAGHVAGQRPSARIVRGLAQPSMFPPALHGHAAHGMPERALRPRTPAPLGGYPADLTTQAVVGAAPLSQMATFNDAPPTRTAIPAPSTPPPVSNSSRPPAWATPSIPAPMQRPSRTRWVAMSALSAGFASMLLAAVWVTHRPIAESAPGSAAVPVGVEPVAVVPAAAGQIAAAVSVEHAQAGGVLAAAPIVVAVSELEGRPLPLAHGDVKARTGADPAEVPGAVAKARTARASAGQAESALLQDAVSEPESGSTKAAHPAADPVMVSPGATAGSAARQPSRGLENAGRRLPGPGIPLYRTRPRGL